MMPGTWIFGTAASKADLSFPAAKQTEASREKAKRTSGHFVPAEQKSGGRTAELP
ncbi:MAG: hypothetical protein HDQ87_00810 [Clostridia bacterium]|nr:hypothetical protein [Clostridia bacterium]